VVAYRVKSVILNPTTDTISVYASGNGLVRTETSAASLTVDADAYLISSDSGDGLALENGPWTVSILGAVGAFETDQLQNAGAAVRISNTNIPPFAASTISVGAGADVYGGRWGIFAEAPTHVVNAATIIAQTNSAIAELGDGTIAIRNSGRIQSLGTNGSADANGSHAIYLGGAGTHGISNTGLIDSGDVVGAYAILSSSVTSGDTVTNYGKILGNIDLGGGADTVTTYNYGSVSGTVQLGDGNDRYTGGRYSETVIDGGGSDVVTFARGGTDIYMAATAANTGLDGTDRITGTGYSIYDASAATSDLNINIDIYAHNSIAARSASGTDIGYDIISGLTIVKYVRKPTVVTGFTTVKAGAGNDEIWGTKYGETVFGGGGADTVIAGLGNDALYGEAGQDALFGGEGNDTVNGGADIDLIDGGNGHDRLDGGDGDDLIYGAAGNDVLSGGIGFDKLAGDVGNDVLNGGDDDDEITGGSGKDYLTGGAGSDTFKYISVLESAAGIATRDIIYDFEIGDRIALTDIDANSKTSTVNDQFDWIGLGVFTKVAGQLRFGFSVGDTVVAGDTNGDGIADFQIQLTGHHLLIAADFVL
jgi:RTX calcium-binding nonapeptide repeat (4 copies)